MKIFRTKLVFVSLIGIISACDQSPDSEFTSSESEKEEVICTMQFVTLHVTVKGGPLTKYFTVRENHPDTLIFAQDGYPDSAMYPILDDSFKERLRDKNDTFHFVGMIDDSIVVYEPYVITADACHIIKVSGKAEVNLLEHD